jgi:hypothetical protein
VSLVACQVVTLLTVILVSVQQIDMPGWSCSSETHTTCLA